MKHIIAFSGSNSSRSINQNLIRATAKMREGIEVIDLRDYPMPIYSYDLEKESGLPVQVSRLIEKLLTADGFIIATPEHNGLPPAFFKNTYDWMSRSGVKYMEDKPTLVMATSDGKRGAQSALAAVEKLLSRPGANIVGRFSLPSYSETFDEEKLEIKNKSFLKELDRQIDNLCDALEGS